MMEPGTVSEPWVCVKRLGTGGYGIVCQWMNKRNRDKIAIKMCRELDNGDPRQKDRWISEIDFMKKIEHPNIVKGLNVEPETFMAFLSQMSPLPPLAMEYCEKGDLRKMLNKTKNLNGLPETEVRNILRSLRNAIEYMHSREITHRDIKPENLVIKEENGINVYKLTDLGYARLIGSSTIEASHVGTFEYFAPEVITEQSYSNTVDYWSMGVIAFEVICGCRPFLPGCLPLECIPKIKGKLNMHIAITMNYSSSDKCQYHTALFVQNQLSSSLKEKLEQWLTIPLAVNPPDRAIVSSNSRRTPDEVRLCQKSPPKPKFYTELDEILETKILTIFCLHTNLFYSYVVTQETTRDNFNRQLSSDTQIPTKGLYLILPLDNLNLSRITETTKPIEMYINGLHDKPMLYCTYLNETRNENRPISCSNVMSNMLSKLDVKSRRHALEFGKHLLFVVRKECQLCTTFINGLTNYSWIINEFLIKFQNQVDEMQQKFWQLQGSVGFFVNQVKYLERMLNERNGFSDVTAIQAKLQKDLKSVNDRFEKFSRLFTQSKQRYTSALRRSHEVLHILKCYPKQIEDEVQAQLTKGENLYLELRSTEINGKVKEMINFFYEFQNSPIFLRSNEIKDVQIRNYEIHEEYEKIVKLIGGLLFELGRFLDEFSSNYSSSLWNVASSVASNDRPNIPNFESIFGSMNLNGEEMDHSHSNGYSMDGNFNDMASIVFENQQLIDEAQSLFRDKMQQD